jgi:hypothetical protein
MNIGIVMGNKVGDAINDVLRFLGRSSIVQENESGIVVENGKIVFIHNKKS